MGFIGPSLWWALTSLRQNTVAERNLRIAWKAADREASVMDSNN